MVVQKKDLLLRFWKFKMRILKNSSIFVLILVSVTCTTFNIGEFGEKKSSIVKIVSTLSVPDCSNPWSRQRELTRTATGILVKDFWILTSFHVVSGARFIQIQKQNDPQRYEAQIDFIGEDCDLALLKVIDRSFYNGMYPLDFSELLPPVGDKIEIYGYRDDDTHITSISGTVSRNMDKLYGNDMVFHRLLVDSDGIFEGGVVGGAVFYRNNSVGVLSKVPDDSDMYVSFITASTISHVFRDVADGVYDGFPTLGILFDTLENGQYRRFLGLSDDQSGVLVTGVSSKSSADGYLIKDDIILKIDGAQLHNDGTMRRVRDREQLGSYLSRKLIGENVSIEIQRNDATMNLSVPLRSSHVVIPQKCVTTGYQRFFVFCGIVFQPLSREIVQLGGARTSRSYQNIRYYLTYHQRDELHTDNKEYVIVNRVLPDPVTDHISNLWNVVVERVNDLEITRLEDVVEAVKYPLGEHHVFEIEGFQKPIILHVADVEKAHERVLKRYHITSESRMSGEL